MNLAIFLTFNFISTGEPVRHIEFRVDEPFSNIDQCEQFGKKEVARLQKAKSGDPRWNGFRLVGFSCGPSSEGKDT